MSGPEGHAAQQPSARPGGDARDRPGGDATEAGGLGYTPPRPATGRIPATRGTVADLARVFAQVSAIVIIPILGGAALGIAADRLLGISSLWVFVGFGIGNLLAIIGIWTYIRTQRRRMAEGDRGSLDER